MEKNEGTNKQIDTYIQLLRQTPTLLLVVDKDLRISPELSLCGLKGGPLHY